MTTRRQMLAYLAAAAVAMPATTRAQDGKKIPRIGMLSLSSGELLTPVREGLRAFGYVDGQNIRFEERAAGDHYERLAEIANEFVKLKVDIIVTSGSSATTAAQRATSTIPIVMVAGVDPVKAGFAMSLARPGGNITGLIIGTAEFTPKRFELAKELIPTLTRVGLLTNPDSRATLAVIRSAESAAKDLKLTLRVFEVRSSDQFQEAFIASRSAVQALVIPGSSWFIVNRKLIIDLAAKFRIPSVYSTGVWVEDGGLASYGSDLTKVRREAARHVDRILRGAKPGEIPIEQPVTLELALNLKTARALGLKIPQVVLLRADKVIE